MQARLRNPATLVPGAMDAFQGLAKVIQTIDIPGKTLGLVHLRVSQINGCAFCIDLHIRHNQKGREDTRERELAIPVWRDSPLFSDAERAALALAEEITHISEDGVSDAVWDEAKKHYNEAQLAGLVVYASTVNLWNRLNVSTRQVPGSAW